jgi:hypothetical protein
MDCIRGIIQIVNVHHIRKAKPAHGGPLSEPGHGCWQLDDTGVFHSNRQSRMMHHAPSVEDEFSSLSRVTRASVESPSRHAGFKTARKLQKDKKFRENVDIFEGHAKIWLLSKCRTGKSAHPAHPLLI